MRRKWREVGEGGGGDKTSYLPAMLSSCLKMHQAAQKSCCEGPHSLHWVARKRWEGEGWEAGKNER